MVQPKVMYNVLCTDESSFDLVDPDLKAMLGGDVAWESFTRSQRPGLFQLPVYGQPTDDQPPKLRHPVKGVSPIVAVVIEKAGTCHIVTSVAKDPPDFGYLDASIALAGQIALEKRGVVIDRTADVGYTAEAMYAQRDVLTVRDTVVIHEEPEGDRVRLWTAGMSKYGRRDFVIESFPAEHVELARRLLYDNLCRTSVCQHPLEVGQAIPYFDDTPSARLFLSEGKGGSLVVQDGRPDGEGPLPGLSVFIELTLPAFTRTVQREAFQKVSADEITPAPDGVATLDDYVELMFLTETGRLASALEKFGLTYETLGTLTDEWEARLKDTALAEAFAGKLEARRAKG